MRDVGIVARTPAEARGRAASRTVASCAGLYGWCGVDGGDGGSGGSSHQNGDSGGDGAGEGEGGRGAGDGAGEGEGARGAGGGGANATSSEPCAAPARPVNWSSTTPGSYETKVYWPESANELASAPNSPSWRPMPSPAATRSVSVSSGSAPPVTCALVVVAWVSSGFTRSTDCPFD